MADHGAPLSQPSADQRFPWLTASTGDKALRQELKDLKQDYEQAHANKAGLTQALQKQAQELTASLSLQQELENLVEESEAEKPQLAESVCSANCSKPTNPDCS